MRTFFIDLVGLAGLGSLCAGVYLQYGIAQTCIVGGGLCLLYAVVASRGRK
ncbi:conserved hypothetical protein [Actinobacillus succinogenes 130Z]|uniref:Uncharacterized protein n=1 Tax=Actinobacillus succinogenes (strain ATCC 55618 / DSM 22257 / CCUG 43843 / 130Z) TaxID=339671 RepID=A6VNQ0_ACTSZ|nr:hypothetical protein [Actinobacillus succinogenes]ABR74597.1 conserved hypothetical protein [Actinobacillus succinogenes 130Z]